MRYQWFMASCIVIILMGVAHAVAAYIAPQPEPKPGDEATLSHLVKTFEVDLPLAKRTTQEIREGFGLFFTLASATMGVVGLQLVRQPVARRIAWIYAGALVLMLANSLVHWFIIPTSFLGLALLLCAISLLPGGRTQGVAA
jgi:hypothetical protein